MSHIIMHLMAKKTGQLSIRISPELVEGVEAIEEKHHLGQAEIVRGLVEAAVKFYQQNGFFSFPVHLEPEASFLHRARTYKSAIEASDAALEPIAKTPKTRKTA
jgi:hypothetical protein